MSGIIINEMENVDEELSEKELERLNFKKIKEFKKRKKNSSDSSGDTGFDSQFQEQATKNGVDTSDVKDGNQENIPGKPDKPLENADDATKTRNSSEGLKDGEHCSTDEQSEATGEESNQESEGLEGTKSAEKTNCIDSDATGLNDLQKEVLWVAIDMLKWQPLTDKERNGKRKRKWENTPESDSFYSNYDYPNDPSFGMHSDMKGFTPLRRLKKFYAGMIKSDSTKIKNVSGTSYATHWCAETVSVIYSFAMASLEVKHKTKNDKGTIVCINSYKNNPNKIPFKRNTQSAAVAANQVMEFDAPASWEPTIGSIFFRSKEPCEDCCGHTGIVLLVNKDKSIITIEGNASNDLQLKYYKRTDYYGKINKSIQNGCGVGTKGSAANKVAPLPFPTKSIWHELFVNPALNENLEWTKKPSREGNPLIELKSLLGGFYNPTGTDGASFETETE